MLDTIDWFGEHLLHVFQIDLQNPVLVIIVLSELLFSGSNVFISVKNVYKALTDRWHDGFSGVHWSARSPHGIPNTAGVKSLTFAYHVGL